MTVSEYIIYTYTSVHCICVYVHYMYTYTHEIISINLSNKVKCIRETVDCELNLKDKRSAILGGRTKATSLHETVQVVVLTLWVLS